MRTTTELHADGPYLTVLLPDVLPPNWEALRDDLEDELDEGASRVTFVAGPATCVLEDDPSLIRLVLDLRARGVETSVHH